MLWVSTVLQTGVTILLAYLALPDEFLVPGDLETEPLTVKWYHCVFCILLGLWSGLIIGFVTEYYTSHTYSPVRTLATSQVAAAATGIIYGLALGYVSCIIPVLLL